MEELLLWRWSTAVQIISALTIALFFVVVGRTHADADARWWVRAWLANAAALIVTWLFWHWQPGGVTMTLLKFAYLWAKTLFVMCLVAGSIAFVGLRLPPGSAATFVLAPALLASLTAGLSEGIATTGVVQASMITVGLGGAALLCLRYCERGVGWLCVGLALRAGLGLVEAAAYALTGLLAVEQLSPQVSDFLGAHSAFDTGAEWMIALGCVLALAHRSHAELLRKNAELREAERRLRVLAERDALTGLANRRMLPELLQAATETGGTLLFFDLDGFKAINDGCGHDVGDACLRRFAQGLRDAFRNEDALVRFAGDEFVVIAREGTPAALEGRVARLRERLGCAQGTTPSMEFSVGYCEIRPGSTVEQVLREADAAMYRQKKQRKRARLREAALHAGSGWASVLTFPKR